MAAEVSPKTQAYETYLEYTKAILNPNPEGTRVIKHEVILPILKTLGEQLALWNNPDELDNLLIGIVRDLPTIYNENNMAIILVAEEAFGNTMGNCAERDSYPLKLKLQEVVHDQYTQNNQECFLCAERTCPKGSLA